MLGFFDQVPFPIWWSESAYFCWWDFEVLGVDWIALNTPWVWALMVMLQVKKLQSQGEGGRPAFYKWWQTGELALQVFLFPFLLPYLPNPPVLVAAVPVFCLHRECDFSCCALASKVLPSLFPPASSVVHPLPQFLRYVQPQKGLLDLKQHLTLCVLYVEVCRETARLFILFLLLVLGS